MSKILIFVESFSIGDTVGALPYIEKFVSLNSDDEIHVSINDWLIPFFQEPYSTIQFIGKKPEENYDKILPLKYLFDKPLQKGYAEQLGFFDGEYIRPKVLIPNMKRPIKGKYITIGVHSTSQMKYWNHPIGRRSQELSPNWNELCGMIRKSGYIPVVVEKDEMFGIPPHRNGMPSSCVKKIGNPLEESMSYIYHSEFFIGLSSGLSWLAHAMGKPVVMISNFTEDWNEFDLNLDDYIRVTNKSKCHGCWNRINKDYSFDSSDWYWCPEHKDTPRQFECHYSITPDYVYKQIEHWLK